MEPSMNRSQLVVVTCAALVGCHSSSNADGGIAGIELVSRVAGLWSGPATNTLLGDFPLINMDMRPAGDSVLFGRVDIDAQNSLRFAFSVEVQGGAPVLVFRNGGLFQGMARDTRTTLVDTDGTKYHFCALQGGCAYVDTTITFQSDIEFDLRVLVRGELHEIWHATRVESRPVPSGFPVRTDLPGDSDFPVMPAVNLHVSWSSAVTAPTDVWTILSTTSCVPSGDCRFSRWIKGTAAAGSTTIDIPLDQVHAGMYSLLAVVDNNGDLESIRTVDSGDWISVPTPTITVAATGVSAASAFADYTFP
jgi:hypothetical protein